MPAFGLLDPDKVRCRAMKANDWEGNWRTFLANYPI
jgi:hypothetical protein